MVTVSAADYKAFSVKAKAADRSIRRNLNKRLRAAARPLGEQVVREGAGTLPASGGLRSHVQANGRVGISSASATGIRMILGTRTGVQLGPLDRGSLRHPVFGRKWVGQSVHAGTFSSAFRAYSGPVVAQVAEIYTDVVRELS